MKVVITGAGGLVGAEFTRQLSADNDVVSLGHDELDVTNRGAVNRAILRMRPALIVNCAVVGVDASESDPSLAYSVNVVGAENLAVAASEIGADLIHFSSNYVFDGAINGGSFYSIVDRQSPLNVYGHTKLAGERVVATAHERSFIVRTSWVFGPGKDSFLSTLPAALRDGKTVHAIGDAYASATYVRDLAKRVLEIVALGRYATYHVVNGGVCSFAEFAFEVARLLGISKNEAEKLIEPARLRDFNFAALRPRYTPMCCKVSDELGLEPMRDWRAAVADYVHTTTRPSHRSNL
jgi:dTDP-4-dehydrorhamnose reductase